MPVGMVSADDRGGRPGSAVAWQLWVDTGGTFTDCLATAPDGSVSRAKVLSSGVLRGRVARVVGARTIEVEARWHLPDGFFVGVTFGLPGDIWPGARVAAWRGRSGRLRLSAPVPPGLRAGDPFELRPGEEAPVVGARLLTGTPFGRPLPATRMRLATTRGTNALLERRGAPVALFVTRGFADLLEIGTQQRPDLFALQVRKPAPLAACVVEVDERLDASGAEFEAVDVDRVRRDARAVLARGIDTAAVALLHAYRDPAHERTVAAVLREAGFTHVSSSAELAPLIGILARAQTAVVNATLAPVVSTYLERVAGALSAGTLHVMTSAGGLVRARDFRPKDSLLSGPAGGVVGAAAAARRSGWERLISFDMGGTSTDVARVDGDHEYVFEHQVGGVGLVAPALAVESVAAGGGSICRFDGRRLLVGPESAGAEPGPACYGAGGPLTVTDANLLLGRLDAGRFAIPVDADAARAAARDVLAAMGTAPSAGGLEAVLEGAIAIADERMAEAIARISLRRGYDPADYVLVAFGGAGGQHACAVARLLGARTVLVPADAGLLSAVGLGHAVLERFAERQVLAPLAEVEPTLPALFASLLAEAGASLVAEGVQGAEIEVRRRICSLRLVGQDSSLALEWDGTPLAAGFETAYRTRYGYRPEARAIEVESVRVVAAARARAMGPPPPAPDAVGAAPADRRPMYLAGSWRRVAWYEREALAPGAAARGPGLVLERHGATVVPAGWGFRVDGAGALVIQARAGADGRRAV